MKAEMIAVGTELLLGQIVNTNAQFLSQQLALLGIDVYYQTVVGDNPHRMKEVVDTARKRADIVILTGGLGPTMDDITKEVVAELLGRNISTHRPGLEKIENMFRERGIHMVESNKRQADTIEGAFPLDNEAGLAIGNAVITDGTTYLLLPGPPKEMKPMFLNVAVPWLKQHVLQDEQALYTRMLKFAGIGESNLEEQLKDLIAEQTDPTIAPYAKEGEVLIRLATKSASQDEANHKLEQLELLIRSRLESYIYATADLPLESIVVDLMTARGLTLASAESCTGGLFAETITSVSGVSAMYLGGVVTYTNEMKHQLLGIPMNVLEGEGAPGAISEQTATLMAEGVMERTNADIAISITGVAGPTESEGKPVGLVYIGIAERDKHTVVEPLKINGNREMVRVRAVKTVLHRLWKMLKQ
ncbi:competence/damage-inducible protein A [Paenibacillus arenosi]|uniref:Putative competence-damage inducible protein n=1 Tax=Paenibacillus arenosi TaxID=2774142 RepID=A0ABR9AV95_9BACL|nr:competence/damage-inducible protein A [Paenibacillus arenosi]MBD8497135.1 competence/damage-inducible protein A [Paenibacillus arenosi]